MTDPTSSPSSPDAPAFTVKNVASTLLGWLVKRLTRQRPAPSVAPWARSDTPPPPDPPLR